MKNYGLLAEQKPTRVAPAKSTAEATVNAPPRRREDSGFGIRSLKVPLSRTPFLATGSRRLHLAACLAAAKLRGGLASPCSSATCSPARRSRTAGRRAAIQRPERTRSGTRRAQPLPRAAINGSRQRKAIGDAWTSWTPSAAQMATRRAHLATDASIGRTSSTRCAAPTHELRLPCFSPVVAALLTSTVHGLGACRI